MNPTEQTEQPQGITYVLMLIDASGSMAPFASDTIGGANQFLDDLAADGCRYEVTIALFSDRDYYRIHAVGDPSDPNLRLDRKSYITQSYTALYDATGVTISNFIDTHNELGEGDKVIMVTITDGEENRSAEWTDRTLRPLIRNLENSGRWTFRYLQTGFDGWRQAERMGYNRHSTVSTANTNSASVAATYTVASRAARSYAGGQSVSDGEVADWMEEEVGKDQVIRPQL